LLLAALIVVPPLALALSSSQEATAVVVVTDGLCVLAIAVTIALVYLIRGYRWSRAIVAIRAERPDAVAFVVRHTPALDAALAESNRGDIRPAKQFIATISTPGLEFWSTRARPVGHPSAQQIESLTAGWLRVRAGRDMLLVRTLFVTPLGAITELPLPMLSDRGILFASAERANSVVAAASRFVRVTTP
jgi:hypothetical protein